MKTTHLLLCLLLLAADVALPLASATHTTDVLDIPLGPPPQVPEDVPVDTPVLVLDEALQDLWDSVGPPANQTLVEAYERYNQLQRDRNELASTGMIRPYSDGMGADVRDGGSPLDPDVRMGGFGEWRVFGDKAWDIREDAARTGVAGFTSATKPDGTYGANVRSLLLSPELDLRTGLSVAPASFAPYVYDHVYSSNPPQEEAYEFIFEARYNLGYQQDGLNILIFTQPPLENQKAWNQGQPFWGPITYGAVGNPIPVPGSRTTTQLTCGDGDQDGTNDHCWEFVEPIGRPYSTMNGGSTPAFSGRSPNGAWTQYTVDLSKWAEQRIWIGFSFHTAGTPPGYFQGDLFNPDLGFYGFQLDDARLEMATVPYSLRVRGLDLPSGLYPDSETGLSTSLLTVPTDEQIPITFDVVNMGSNKAEVQAKVRLYESLEPEGLMPIHTSPDLTMDLDPGESGRFEYVLPGLPNTSPFGSQFTVEAEAKNVEQRYESFAHDPDPDSTDQLMDLGFNVITYEDVSIGQLQQSSTYAGFGESISFDLSVHNEGNRNLTIDADACGIDLLADMLSCDQDLFVHLVEGTRQSVDLGPGLEHTFHWTAKSSATGQHRVFVRAGTDLESVRGFSLDDLRTDLLEPVRSRHVKNITVDGDLSEPAWDVAAGGILPGEMGSVRVLNNDTHAFFSIQFNGTLDLLLDDLADQVLQHGAGGGFQAGGDDGTWQDLSYNATTRSWQTSTGDKISKVVANGTWYEASIPIDSGAPGAPTAGVGEFFSFMLSQGGAGLYPQGARSGDGNGNGLVDELQAWQPVRLGMPDDVASDASARRFEFRGLSAGFGIERSPPPILKEDFQQCPDMAQWVQQGITTQFGMTEQWNCGTYGEDRRLVLYEGLTPGSVCLTECGSYSRLGAYESAYNAVQTWTGTTDSSIIYTKPFEIDSSQPYLYLQHQYSTESWILDDWGTIGDPFKHQGHAVPKNYMKQALNDEPTIQILSAGRVYLEIWDEDQNIWQSNNRILLRPEGGYPTEETIGIADPRLDKERFVAVSEGTRGLNYVVGDPEGVGFWWPTGHQPLYREAKDIPLEEDLVSGGTFQGSPWVLDRFRLFGNHLPFQGALSTQGGAIVPPTPIPPQQLDLQGKTVRLAFDFQRSGYDEGDGERDYGWRIGGIAVADGERFRRDLAVDDVRVGELLYDPMEAGVGPGTTVPVVVTLSNQGRDDLPGIRIKMQGLDAKDPDAPPLCAWDEEYALSIAAGESRKFEIACDIPSGAKGSLLLLHVDAEPGTGDDFPPNNQRNARDVLEVRTTKDVAVQVTADPGTASSGVRRTVTVVVENRGNVPVSDFDVELQLQQVVGVGTTEALGHPTTWHVISDLPANTRLRLDDERLQTDPPVERTSLFFKPPFEGVFQASVRAVIEDEDPANNVAEATMQARSLLYQETLDRAPFMEPGTVTGERSINGTKDVWGTQSGSHDSSKRLVAGDPSTGEIPASADGSIILPDMDLTTVKGATLTLMHRYALEEGFDGVRLEASADGENWHPLPPQPQPLGDLPEGHPSIPMLGITPLLGGEAEATAVAFTGNSADLNASQRDTFGRPTGWIASEFDLSDHPDLQRRTAIDAFSLHGFASRPQDTPEFSATGERQFRDSSWVLEEPGAEGNQRYWWIQDVIQDIAPHSGNTAWWSGTAGTEDEGFQEVNTRLDYQFDVPVRDAEERTFLQWWEYRTGSGDHPSAVGTGGTFGAHLHFEDLDSDGVPDVREVQLGTDRLDNDTDDDGWIDGKEVTAGFDPLDDGSLPSNADCTIITGPRVPKTPVGPNEIPLNWISQYLINCDPEKLYSAGDGFRNSYEATHNTNPAYHDTDADGYWDGEEVANQTDPRVPDIGLVHYSVVATEGGWIQRELDVTPYAGLKDMVMRFSYRSDPSSGFDRLENNLGYLVDDVALVSYRVDNATGRRTDSVVHLEDDLESPGSPGWSIDSQSGAGWHRTGEVDARGTAWGVQSEAVPGLGPTPVWRFGDDSDQGYPHGIDARLVTPVVDLGAVVGDDARLTFDHRYGFESVLRSCRPQCALHDFTSALDAGVVEVQVFDETTGQFGPWQQIGAEYRDFPEVRFEFDQVYPRPYSWVTVNYRPQGMADRDFYESGYSAVSEKGEMVSKIFDEWDGINHPDSCGMAYRGPLVPNGIGSTFERHLGLAKWRMQCPDSSNPYSWRFISWREYGYTPVFSGDSGGWQKVDWDVSPLIGKQVRFAFHVATNPSLTQNHTLPSGVQEPWAGWSIANVAVEGDLFQGKPVQLRLRVATDDSLTKGEWSVDDIELVGDRYKNNVAVLADSEREIRVDQDESVTFDGRVANIGTFPRGGLALAVQAFDSNKQPFDLDKVDIRFDGEAPEEAPSVLLPTGTHQAFGPFSLTPGGRDGSTLPFHIEVDLPDKEERVTLRVQVLQAVGAPVQVDGKEAFTYVRPDNEVSGNTFDTWVAVGSTVTDLQAEGDIQVQPDVLRVGTPIRLSSTVQNDGTTEPFVVAKWTAYEVRKKGDPDAQPEVGKEVRDTVLQTQEPLGVLLRGGTATSNATFTPERAGLYRAVVEYAAGGGVRDRVQFEFLVDTPAIYYQVDFAQANGTAGWVDASPPPSAQQQGGSPGPIRFRSDGTSLIWGVDAGQIDAGQNYCSFGGCMTVATGSSYIGLEGIADGPPIDLTRVPQGQAILVLQHSMRFTEDDGARVEFVPYVPRSGGNPQPAVICKGQPAAYIPQPIEVTEFDDSARFIQSRTVGNKPMQTPGSVTTPQLNHPFAIDASGNLIPGSLEMLGGDRVQETLVFDLSTPAQAADLTCLPQALDLVNYTVVPRLHTGQLPGVSYNTQRFYDTAEVQRTGDQGWQIHGIAVSSIGLEVTPEERRFPVLDGAPKFFGFNIQNVGQVADAFHIRLDRNGSTLPPGSDWIHLSADQVRLGAGETRTIPFQVDIPPDPNLSRGAYVARIEVQSASAPSIVDTIDFTLDLQGNPLPDLSASLSTDEGGQQVPQGSITPIYVTVRNLGKAETDPVHVQLFATDGDGVETPIGTLDLEALCPQVQCGGGSRRTLSADWVVPDLVGNYTISALVDVDGRLLEERLDNNAASMQLEVVPLAVPDLAITALEVEGVAEDGFAEEGDLIVYHATVTNLGLAEARNVQVQVLADSALLAEESIPVLGPGQSRDVSAFKVAFRGESIATAFVLPDDRELNTENNQFKQAVRVRGHELVASLVPEQPLLEPGEVATVLLNVSNGGNTVERLMVSLENAPGWNLSMTPDPLFVPPGKNGSASLRVLVPEDAVAGIPDVRIVVAPATNAGAAVAIEQPFAVAVTGGPPVLESPGVSTVPGTVDVPVNLTSVTNTPQNLTLRLVSPDWPHEPVRLSLQPYQRVPLNLSVAVPAGTSPGNHTVQVEAALPDGTVLSQVAVPVEVLEQRRVEVDWSEVRARLAADVGNQSHEVLLHAANTGNVPVALTLVPTDLAQNISASVVVGEVLEPGATQILVLRVDSLTDVPAPLFGTVQVWMRAAGAEGRGVLVETLALPDPTDAADLHVTRMETTPRNVREGEAVRVSAVVENRGVLLSNTSRLHIYLDGALLEDLEVPAVPPGEQAVVNATWTARRGGTFHVIALADAEESVGESEEANNGLSTTLDVEAAPVSGFLGREAPAAPVLPVLLACALLAWLRRRGAP